MTTLITGGAGFVGLNIASELLLAGQDVVIFDLGEIKSSAHVDLLQGPGQLTLEKGSVLDKEHLVRCIDKYHITQVVHGAAITAGLAREQTQAAQIVQVNTIGTVNVLDACLQKNVQRVVSLGTGSVYGSTVKKEGTLDEVTDLPEPQTLYGISKYAAERIALRYRDTRGLDIVVARLGVVFGRYEHDTGLRDTLSAPLILGQLALQAKDAKVAKVYRHLPNDWVYATDVARAVKLLLNASLTPSPVYHIATGQAWSIESWCKKLSAYFPEFRYELVEDQSQAAVGRVTPSARPCFSIDRLRRELGYEPCFLLDAAFDDYAQWLITTSVNP
jgi:nucleoside-diphosphate-sugar epimerase